MREEPIGLSPRYRKTETDRRTCLPLLSLSLCFPLKKPLKQALPFFVPKQTLTSHNHLLLFSFYLSYVFFCLHFSLQRLLDMATSFFATSPSRLLLQMLPTVVTLPLLWVACVAQASVCRTDCGGIQVRYPFGIDDGCGSLLYRNLLLCDDSTSPPHLRLRTPSGIYHVRDINYYDAHLIISDPSMWSCKEVDGYRAAVFNSSQRPPFSLDASTRLALSPRNNYLFFNCSHEAVIVQPKSSFCDQFPERCASVCDSTAYLCRNTPECPDDAGRAMSAASCCSYYPKASESLRLMLRFCTTYTSIYWRTVGLHFSPNDQVPEYGIRIDFEIPLTTGCLQCQDAERLGGICGFDTARKDFLCLCREGNATTNCSGRSSSGFLHHLLSS